MTTTLQPRPISETTRRELVLLAGNAQDAAYDALQAFADALYEEAVLVQGKTPEQADLVIRGILANVGTEMAHDWEYGPEAP